MEQQTRSVDWALIVAMCGLLLAGFLLVFTATVDEPGSRWQKQLIFFVAGFIGLLTIMLFPPRFFYVIAYPFYFFSLLPLAWIAFFKQTEVERWIDLGGGFKLQPSEFSKFALLLVLARHLSLNPVSLRQPKSLLVPFGFFIVPFILVLKQPDLSTALVFAAMLLAMSYWAGMKALELFLLLSPLLSVAFISYQTVWAVFFLSLFVVMFLARMRLYLLVSILLVNIVSAYSAILLWQKVLMDHQRARILTFLDPMRDPKGEGYQVLQSLVAIGSGGLVGKGFGQGSQTNLSFLPEEHTDFIFSVLGEQFGFVGCLVVYTLYFLLLYRVLAMCIDFRSPFINLVAVGVASILGFHIVMNSAMTMGLVPVTGIPIPFLSYGGSFVLTCMFLIAILVNFRFHGQNL